MADLGVSALDDVAKTGLLTAFCHAIESRRPNAILKDPEAERIAERLTPAVAVAPEAFLRRLAAGKARQDLVVHLAVRARRYDRYARDFLARRGSGCVLNLGCGLDTRFWRIDDNRAHFYDLDLPEMVSLKRQLVEETERYRLIGRSVLDFGWMDDVLARETGPFLFLAEGLFMYLSPEGVRSLVLELQARFAGSELVFETVNAAWLKPSLKWMIDVKLQKELGLGPGTQYRFGISAGPEVEEWSPGIRFLGEWSYVDEDEPRIGVIRWFRHWQWLRRTQWTVRYALGRPDPVGTRGATA